METLFILLCVFLVVFIFNKNQAVEQFKSSFFSDTKKQLGDFNFRKNINDWWPLVERSNQLVKGWVLTFVPNVGWVYKLGDKIIEYQRAKNGLPAMKRAKAASVNVNINSSNKRMRFW